MSRLTLALCLLLILAPAAAQPRHLTLGLTPWPDAELVTRLAARLLETRLDYQVSLRQDAIARHYQNLANGEIDAMLMAWLPRTHADYFQRFGDDLVDLGPVYQGVRVGWVVPDYVPREQASTLADLSRPQVAQRFNHRIQGIDPGAGLMRLSRAALQAYDLNQYSLVSASGAGMAAALARAVKRKRWIVVTGWSPHWMFGRFDLRYLDDPKGVLGGTESVHALGRQGLERDHPDAATLLRRLELPLNELQNAMARATGASVDEAVTTYIENHPQQIEQWLEGL